MRAIIWLKTFLVATGLGCWLLFLWLAPFDDGGTAVSGDGHSVVYHHSPPTPGYIVLLLVCTLGLLSPDGLTWAALNYWFLLLTGYNLTGRSWPALGVAFLCLFAANVGRLLFEQCVVEDASLGRLQWGSLPWFVALLLMGIATLFGERTARESNAIVP